MTLSDWLYLPTAIVALSLATGQAVARGEAGQAAVLSPMAVLHALILINQLGYL